MVGVLERLLRRRYVSSLILLVNVGVRDILSRISMESVHSRILGPLVSEASSSS